MRWDGGCRAGLEVYTCRACDMAAKGGDVVGRWDGWWRKQANNLVRCHRNSCSRMIRRHRISSCLSRSLPLAISSLLRASRIIGEGAMAYQMWFTGRLHRTLTNRPAQANNLVRCPRNCRGAVVVSVLDRKRAAVNRAVMLLLLGDQIAPAVIGILDLVHGV